MASTPRPTAPRNAPESTPTFLGRGTRTTDEPAEDMSRGMPGDLMFEALPAEISLRHFTGPYRNPRTGRPPPDPVGGYGTDEYAPGFIAGQRFPTWNITPGNRVFDLGSQIPYDWIPYRGGPPDAERVESEPGDVWSNNFDPAAAGMWTPADLEARGQGLLQQTDQFNNPGIGFFGPRRQRFIPMKRGGRGFSYDTMSDEEWIRQTFSNPPRWPDRIGEQEKPPHIPITPAPKRRGGRLNPRHLARLRTLMRMFGGRI